MILNYNENYPKEGLIITTLKLLQQNLTVIIDDLFPLDSQNKLLFNKGSIDGNLWAPFLDKAVAKLYGSYSKLERMSVIEAWRLFNPAPSEVF